MERSESNRNTGMAEDPNDILVFGYACKLFRDDDKAAWIEDENHLIPWMGDSNVKIDRYDGRGALMDLSGNAGEGTEALEGMSLDEAKFEEMLDKERYQELREDSEFDDTNYQEVEFKKFQCDVNDSVGRRGNTYGAVGYCYDPPVSPSRPADSGNGVSKADDERPFTCPTGLIVPSNLALPPTMKLHSIIEKTAKFIASHGSQMEIILKTKQSGNPLFNFLDYKDSLNPYFKFLVQAIRENSYSLEDSLDPPVPQTASEPISSLATQDEEDSNSEDEGGYLHPSLFSSSTDSSSLPLPQINFKSNSGSSAYSLLVSKIRGSSNSDTPSPTPSGPTTNSSNNTFNGSYGQSSSQYYNQYSQDQTTSQENQFTDFNNAFTRPPNQVPTPNDQLVIEKMASYVVKNGIAFEELAKTKGDARFVFLSPSHEFHWYYLNCKERFKAESGAVVANQQFMSYSSEGNNNNRSTTPTLVSTLTIDNVTTTTEPTVPQPTNTMPKRLLLKSVELPLSESGIPIANLESICNRPTSINPEVASRIELIKKKNSLFAKKEKPQPLKIQFYGSSIEKRVNLNAEEDIKKPTTNETETEIPPPQLITIDHLASISSSIPISEYPAGEISGDSDKSSVPDPVDAERLRKEMRRQKAALFLQLKKITPSNPISEDLISSTSTNNNIESEDVQNLVNRKGGIEVDQASISIEEEKNECQAKINELNERLSPELDSSSNDQTDRKVMHKRARSDSRSRSRSPSYRRSRSSFESSDSNFSESSTRKKKRSKRKTSKKRKKKHSHERSSSKSRKKSKKHKR